jgi:hypothetical protein
VHRRRPGRGKRSATVGATSTAELRHWETGGANHGPPPQLVAGRRRRHGHPPAG